MTKKTGQQFAIQAIEKQRLGCNRGDFDVLGLKATPHKEWLPPLPCACLHIFRHIAQKIFDIRQYACKFSVQSDKKSDCAITRQSLCGVALRDSTGVCYNMDKLASLKPAHLSKHMDKHGVLTNIPVISGQHILRSLVKNGIQLPARYDEYIISFTHFSSSF